MKPVFWIIPEVGTFNCFKVLQDGVIAELQVPHEAKRVCNLVNPRKFRVEYARVIALTDRDGNAVTSGRAKACADSLNCGTKCMKSHLEYVVGEMVHPHAFDDSMLKDCAPGIHAWNLRQEAVAWDNA